MNNSSANNVLLKSVQAPAVQTAASKRNYQDDQSASFQQRLKDIHKNARAQDEAVKKPAPKKAAALDNAKPSNDVEKSRSVPTKHTDENRSHEKADEAKNNSDTNDTHAKQDSNIQANKPDESASRELAKNSGKKSAANTTAEDETDSSLTNPVIAAVPVVLKDVAMPADVIATGAIDVASIIASGFNLPAGTAKAESTQAVDSSEVVTPSVSAEVQAPDQSLLSSVDTIVAPDAELAQNQQVEIDVITSQPTQDLVAPVSTDEIADQSTVAIAAAGTAALPKTPATQAATSVSPEEDASVTDGLGVSPTTENPPTKPAPLAEESKTLSAEANQKQNLLLDPKSGFEKTLQNLAQPDVRAKDDNLQQPVTATSSAPSTNALDSLMRFSDTNTPAARSFVVQTAVPVPVGQPQWSQAVGDKVLWLAAQNVSSAEINLNPEHLGPMQVKVSVNQEQTSVSFTSHHAVVREVLDQNLGRLRDMFSEQGLNLVNVDVSDKSFSRQQGDAQHQGGQGAHKESSVEEEAPVAVSLIKQQRLVDHYA